MKLKNRLRRIFNPQPIDQNKIGFEANIYIRSVRFLCRTLICLLRLNGRNRFSNEFIQALDPMTSVTLDDGTRLKFRTGHGRLMWRTTAFGNDEPLLAEWISKFNDTECFYDIGACVGNYSLWAGSKGVQVISIEAETNNFQLLYDNIHLNGLYDEVFPVHMALHNETGTQQFYVRSFSKGDALHTIGRKSIYLDDFKGFMVPTLVMRLDDLIETFNLPQPTKIKIDVDTNELKIIQGAEKTLAHCNEVYIEMNFAFEEHLEVISIMEAKGFYIVKKEPEIRDFLSNSYNVLFSKVGQ